MKQKIFTLALALALSVSGVAHAKSIGSSSSRSSSSSSSSSSKSSTTTSNGPLGGKAVGYQRSDLPKPVAPAVPTSKPAVAQPTTAAQPSMIGSNVGKPQAPTYQASTQANSGMSTTAKVATGVALGAVGGAVLANTMSGSNHQNQNQQQSYPPQHSQPPVYQQPQQETVYQNAPAPQVVYQQAPSVQQTQPQVQVIEKTIIKEVPAQSNSSGGGFFWFLLLVILAAVLVGAYYVSKKAKLRKSFDAVKKASSEFASDLRDDVKQTTQEKFPSKWKENTAVGGTPATGTGHLNTAVGYTDETRFTTIQTAFAKGDKETLKRMLSTDLYESFLIEDLDADWNAKSTVSLDQMQFARSEDDSVYSVLYNFTDSEDPSNPVKRSEWWHYDLSSNALVGIQPVE